MAEKSILKKYKFHIKFSNFFSSLRKKGNSLKLSSFCVYIKSPQIDRKAKIDFSIGGKEVKTKFLSSKGIKIWKNIYINHYSILIPIDDLYGMEINNSLEIKYQDKEGELLQNRIKFSALNLKYKAKRSKIVDLGDGETIAYFHEALSTAATLRVRNKLKSDKRREQVKTFIASIIAKIMGNSNRIILFEKFSERYEESASVLYEKLIDLGYTNAYFVLAKDEAEKLNIEDKYKKNIIEKYTFKHYLEFFRAKKFMGSDVLAHAIDLRISDKTVQKRIRYGRFDFVFLQHGVKYMVAFPGDIREFLISKNKNAKFKAVVSSELEAEHFLELNEIYNENDIYITGLPKFDRNTLKDNPEKVAVMLTWRAWDYNLAKNNFTETSYYKFLMKIIGEIPEELKKHLVIMPHPLMLKQIESFGEISKYISKEENYGKILENTKVLITDYSSIAYDAFYRGTNIVFAWEEKKESLAKYGDEARLMIDESNIFGDIAYSTNDIEALVKSNYNEGQKERYINKFRKIVEFHDGKNTDRLIDSLKRGDII